LISGRLFTVEETIAMLITVDVSNPDNDVELIGLAPGEAPEQRFGPRGYVAFRLFNAAARLLFLAIQRTEKADIAAATEMQIERESSFVRERLQELSRSGPSHSPDGQQGRQNGRRRGDRR
jgi:hypothetical protein